MEKFREKLLKTSIQIARERLSGNDHIDLEAFTLRSSEYLFLNLFEDFGEIRSVTEKFSEMGEDPFREVLDEMEKDPESLVRRQYREDEIRAQIVNKKGFIVNSEKSWSKKTKKISNTISIIAKKEIFDEISSRFLLKEEDDEKFISLLVNTARGYGMRPMPLKKQVFSLENYNPDLPHGKIVEELNKEGSGLFIFHGKPGCGKTSYIRELVHQVDRNFIYLDPKILSNMENDSLISILSGYKNSIVVIEDCEKLIQERGREGRSGELNTLLNMTDGILGDSFNLKFICTFNSPVSTIDRAFLRNGRLRIIYEFKDLSADRVKSLAEKLKREDIPSRDMALCDVYNWDPTKVVQQYKKVIGFASYDV